MKNLLWASLAVLGIGMASCSNEDEFEMNSAVKGNDVISAELPKAMARTHMNGVSVLWTAGDKIGIIGTKENASPNVTPYTLKDNTANTASGSFTGAWEEGYTKVAAVYPYNENITYDASEYKLSLELLDSYDYDASNPDENNKAPMACIIDAASQNAVNFKNAGALMYITLKNIPADLTAVLLTTGDNGPAIAGGATIEFDGQGNPTLKIDAEATKKTITINVTNSTAATEKSFYFPLPVANYTSLKLQAIINGQTQDLKSKALNAAAGQRYKTTLEFDAVTGSIPATATLPSNVDEALAQNNSVVVSDVTDSDNTITLPQSSTNNPVSISLEKISTTNAININEATTGTGSVSDDVTLSIPADANPSVVVSLPNSTFTLAASGETAVYNEATVETSDNTLVLGKGVTVTTLNIKKGNVRLKTGSSFRTIAKTNDCAQDIIYIYNESGTPLTNLPTGFVEINAAEMALHDAFAAGENYTLTQNVTIHKPLELNNASANMTLDLNGYDITNSTSIITKTDSDVEVFIVSAGTLTIEGEGTILAQNTASDMADYAMAIWAKDNGKVNIKGGSYVNTLDNNVESLDLIYARDNAVINIHRGTFESKSKDSKGTYWVLNKKDGSDAQINVYGGTFINYNPAASLTENPQANFVASGLVAETSEGKFEVLPAENGVVTLTEDLEIVSPIAITSNVTINLNDCDITNKTPIISETDSDVEVFIVSAGTLTIEGEGTILAQNTASDKADYAMAIWAKDEGKVDIRGGSYVNTLEGSNAESLDLIYARDNAVINIYGGTFESKSKDSKGTYWVLNKKDGSNAQINVHGGTFINYNPAASLTENPQTNFVASGLVVETAENKFEVFPEVDGAVTLSNDLVVCSQITVLEDLTLNLGNHTIEPASGVAIWNDTKGVKTWSMVSVQGGHLTINSETDGAIAAANEDSYAVDVRNGAKLTINGGNYVGNISSIYNRGGAVTINGGRFSIQQLSTQVADQPYRFVLNCLDETTEDGAEITSTISVTGGTFVGFNPADAYSDPQQPTSYVAAGHKSEVSKEATETTPAEYTVTAN